MAACTILHTCQYIFIYPEQVDVTLMHGEPAITKRGSQVRPSLHGGQSTRAVIGNYADLAARIGQLTSNYGDLTGISGQSTHALLSDILSMRVGWHIWTACQLPAQLATGLNSSGASSPKPETDLEAMLVATKDVARTVCFGGSALIFSITNVIYIAQPALRAEPPNRPWGGT